MNISKIVLGPVGTNTLIVPLNNKYSFIVDPANFDESSHRELQSVLDYLKTTPIAIVLTHGHFDHVSGISFLHQKFNIPIFISKEDSIFIGPSSELFQLKLLESCYFESFLPKVSNLPQASGFLKDGTSLKNCWEMQNIFAGSTNKELIDAVNNLADWKIIATPGHSRGSVCLYNEIEKQLICGDTLFDGGWGRTDLYSGSESEIIESLKNLKNKFGGKNYCLWSGHGFCGFSI